jgi:hypothetical protein
MILKIDSCAKVVARFDEKRITREIRGLRRLPTIMCPTHSRANFYWMRGQNARRCLKGRPSTVTQQRIERSRVNSRQRAEWVLAASVVGYRLFRMSPGDVPALRRRPGPVPEGWQRVPPSLLRYADEQTVAGTAAVFAAMAAMAAPHERFRDWGVVAASRYLGRANLAIALRSFMAEGVWGTSPHLIPHFALHSQSGTISLALGSHGPNLGVGGGLYAAADGFLAALTWLAAGVVPGVWLILSGWSPELVPPPSGNAPMTGECQALALAIVKASIEDKRPAFRARFGGDREHADAPLNLEWLEKNLAGRVERSPRTIATDARGRLCIELYDGSDISG